MPLTPEKAGESRPGPEGKRKRNEPDEAERRKKEKEVFSDIVGVFNGEGPPVPIPNTEVKLTSAENTCLATGRENRGQAKKSARGMPWHQEPMKDVTSCDKLRGAANKR